MPESPSPRPGGRDEAPTEPEGFERFLRPYYQDSTLWPVLFVLVAAFATFGAAMLLLALRLRNPYAMAALAILVVASTQGLLADLRRRRLGAGSVLLLTVWGLSGLTALAAARFGLF